MELTGKTRLVIGLVIIALMSMTSISELFH